MIISPCKVMDIASIFKIGGGAESPRCKGIYCKCFENKLDGMSFNQYLHEFEKR